MPLLTVALYRGPTYYGQARQLLRATRHGKPEISAPEISAPERMCAPRPEELQSGGDEIKQPREMRPGEIHSGSVRCENVRSEDNQGCEVAPPTKMGRHRCNLRDTATLPAEDTTTPPAEDGRTGRASQHRWLPTPLSADVPPQLPDEGAWQVGYHLDEVQPHKLLSTYFTACWGPEGTHCMQHYARARGMQTACAPTQLPKRIQLLIAHTVNSTSAPMSCGSQCRAQSHTHCTHSILAACMCTGHMHTTVTECMHVHWTTLAVVEARKVEGHATR